MIQEVWEGLLINITHGDKVKNRDAALNFSRNMKISTMEPAVGTLQM